MTFTSLPTGVNLSRSAIRPSTSSLPTPPAPAPQTPAPPAKSETAPHSSSEATSSQPPVLPASSSQPPVSPASSSQPPVLPASSGLEKEESLEDENARLKEQRTCKVCMDGEVNIIILIILIHKLNSIGVLLQNFKKIMLRVRGKYSIEGRERDFLF